MNAQLNARTLLTHEDENFRETGVAGSFAWHPSPASERGPKLTLSQSVGAPATGGMNALLQPEGARVLDRADERATEDRP